MPCLISLLFLFSISLSSTTTTTTLAITSHFLPLPVPDGVEAFGEREFNEKVPWKTPMRSLIEGGNVTANASLILASNRTNRKDPTENFTPYTGGWNITNTHYLWVKHLNSKFYVVIVSVAFTAFPFFVVAAVWFVFFGVSLSIICLCYCCCPREPYGYSRFAYALSLIFLIVFTIAAIAGCLVLYTGQGKFHESTKDTLKYVVGQADFTAENLRNVSDYLSAAKTIGVDAVFLPTDLQKNIDDVVSKIYSAAVTLSTKTADNSDKIKEGLDGVGLALIILAAVMLFLAFIGLFDIWAAVYCILVSTFLVEFSTSLWNFLLPCGIFYFLVPSGF
ncbi:hypothetical protein Lal_00003656 [Lupinus albus]|nr:hypothetical protein Lal_00003656 [Lupinus albus]